MFRKILLTGCLSLSLIWPAGCLASTAVTATVPDNNGPTIPILIAPPNGTITADNTPTFIFQPSTDAQSPVWLYQMYLNKELFITELPASQTPSETNQFQLVNASGQISFTLKQPLPDGTYTWSIRAYDIYKNYTDSATWTFTIDTQAPFIIVNQINGLTDLNLSSNDPTSIPENTVLNIKERRPVFSGQTEAGSAVQIVLTPYDKNTNLLNTAAIVLNGLADKQGRFSFIPDQNLIYDLYRVQVSASDGAHNTVVLPAFKLKIEEPTATIIPPKLPIPFIFPSIPLPKVPLYPVSPLAKLPYLPVWPLLTAWFITSLGGYGLAFCQALTFLYLLLWPFGPKGKHWVFDGQTQKRLPFSRIFVFLHCQIPPPATKLNRQFLTNRKGGFNLDLEHNDVYSLEAKTYGYFFPDRELFAKTKDNPEIYFGQNFLAENKNELSVPLVRNEKYRLRTILLGLAWLFLLASLLVGLYNLVLFKTWYDLLILLGVSYLTVRKIV